MWRKAKLADIIKEKTKEDKSKKTCLKNLRYAFEKNSLKLFDTKPFKYGQQFVGV